MTKRPAFQFYPGDWRTDTELRLCAMLSRGLWMDMLAIMHEGEPYGHLTAQGRPISPDMLARLVGESPATVRRALGDLEVNGVFSRTDDGVIYSRRMVRDEGVREARAAGGSLGKEHGHKGASHGAKGGRPRKNKTPQFGNARGVILPPPSISSPSSSPSPDKDDDVDERTGAIDLIGFTADLARMAGVGHLAPGRITQNIDTVREWIDHGATADEMREAVKEGVSAASAAIHSLKYFSGAVRQRVAKRENGNGPVGQGSAAEQSGDGILRAAAARRAARRTEQQAERA